MLSRGEALKTTLESIPKEQVKDQLEVGYLYQTPTEQEMREGLYNCTTFTAWALSEKGIDLSQEITVDGVTATLDAFINITPRAPRNRGAVRLSRKLLMYGDASGCTACRASCTMAEADPAGGAVQRTDDTSPVGPLHGPVGTAGQGLLPGRACSPGYSSMPHPLRLTPSRAE